MCYMLKPLILDPNLYHLILIENQILKEHQYWILVEDY